MRISIKKNSVHRYGAAFVAVVLLVLLAVPALRVLAIQFSDITRESVSSSGAQSNDSSYEPFVSATGRYVVFDSDAANLVSGDTNGSTDVFIRDTSTGIVTRVSLTNSGGQSTGYAYTASVSSDGRYVAFASSGSDLVSGDTNGVDDIFVRDRTAGTTTRVSIATAGTQADSFSTNPKISADGRYVVFSSNAANLVSGDTNAKKDIFVRDLQTNTTTRVSVDSSGTQSNNTSDYSSISADGRYVAFQSFATNLVSGDTNGLADVFVHDRTSGTTERINVKPDGLQTTTGGANSPFISSDGGYVVFDSVATDLVSGDTNSDSDVFVRNRTTNTTTRVSVASDGTQGDNTSDHGIVSTDGRFVAFASQSTNLVSGDTNGTAIYDVFVHSLETGATVRINLDNSGGQSAGSVIQSSITMASDGRYVGFSSNATDLVGGDTNAVRDIFVATVADDDGVSDSIENAGPNNGDANGDGYSDATQDNVASLSSSVSGNYVAIQTDGCGGSTLVGVSISTAESETSYTYPAGLAQFSVNCAAAGGTATITQYYYGNYDPDQYVLRKYNSSTKTYTTVSDATLTSVTVGSETALKVVYAITDGGSLDEDNAANGVIVDPVGIAAIIVNAPDTGFAHKSTTSYLISGIIGVGLITYELRNVYRKNQAGNR